LVVECSTEPEEQEQNGPACGFWALGVKPAGEGPGARVEFRLGGRRTGQQWRPTMLRSLRRLRVNVKGQSHVRNLDRCQDLIERSDYSSLRRVLTGLDIDSVQMREVSPMGGLLSQGERSEVLGLAL
jgi:hypothetical protein